MKRLISMLLLLAMLLSCLPVSVSADDTAITEAEEIVDAAPAEDADAEEPPEEEPLEEEIPTEETPDEQSAEEEMAAVLSADGESFFYFSAETKKELLIAPRKVPFTAGQRICDALEAAGITLKLTSDGFLSAINGVAKGYDKLDKNGKALLKTEYKQLTACEKTLKKNEKAVQKVQTLLAKLPAAEDVMTKLSLTDKKNVTAAEKAYNPLTEDQRTFLTEDEHAKMQANSERMQTLIEGETLIKAAEKAIKSLPADTKIKATDSKKLETAQEAYDKVKNSEDGLTIDPKLAEKFETSRTVYYAYQQQAEDFRSEYLDALPKDANAVTAEYETAIPAARTAYKALSKNVQSFIEKAEVSHLSACEKTLKKSKSAAVKVDKLIAKLPADVNAEFTAKDEKAINAAWKAYSKLTSEQKTFLEDEQHLLDCYNKAYPEG